MSITPFDLELLFAFTAGGTIVALLVTDLLSPLIGAVGWVIEATLRHRIVGATLALALALAITAVFHNAVWDGVTAADRDGNLLGLLAFGVLAATTVWLISSRHNGLGRR